MIKILTNTAGTECQGFRHKDAGFVDTVHPDFENQSVIGSPRAIAWRSTTTYNAYTRRALYMDAGTTTPDVDYIVVTRADWLLTEDRTDLLLLGVDSTVTDTTLASYVAPAAPTLTGVRSQDWVEPITRVPGFDHQYGILWDTSGDEAMRMGTFCPSVAFDFDTEVVRDGYSLQLFGEDYQVWVGPKFGKPFETEATMTLKWVHVTSDKLEEFKQLPFMQDVPFFLYDTTGDVFTHELEHVIMTSYSSTQKASDLHEVEITVQRLRHYE